MRRTTTIRIPSKIQPGNIWARPAADPGSATDDFTPPFPAYVSGHATMGGAIFKTLELFYGTNDFATADAAIGADPVTAQYTLHSTNQAAAARDYYVRFTQVGPLGPDLENSPEGENSMSRVYLGVHWRIDQEDGQALGHAVAQYVASNFFQAVPEPSFRAAGSSRHWSPRWRLGRRRSRDFTLLREMPDKSGRREDFFLQRVDELDQVNRVEPHQDISRAGRIGIRALQQQHLALNEKALKGHRFVERAHDQAAFRQRRRPLRKKLSPHRSLRLRIGSFASASFRSTSALRFKFSISTKMLKPIAK